MAKGNFPLAFCIAFAKAAIGLLLFSQYCCGELVVTSPTWLNGTTVFSAGVQAPGPFYHIQVQNFQLQGILAVPNPSHACTTITNLEELVGKIIVVDDRSAPCSPSQAISKIDKLGGIAFVFYRSWGNGGSGFVSAELRAEKAHLLTPGVEVGGDFKFIRERLEKGEVISVTLSPDPIPYESDGYRGAMIFYKIFFGLFSTVNGLLAASKLANQCKVFPSGRPMVQSCLWVEIAFSIVRLAYLPDAWWSIGFYSNQVNGILLISCGWPSLLSTLLVTLHWEQELKEWKVIPALRRIKWISIAVGPIMLAFTIINSIYLGMFLVYAAYLIVWAGGSVAFSIFYFVVGGKLYGVFKQRRKEKTTERFRNMTFFMILSGVASLIPFLVFPLFLTPLFQYVFGFWSLAFVMFLGFHTASLFRLLTIGSAREVEVENDYVQTDPDWTADSMSVEMSDSETQQEAETETAPGSSSKKSEKMAWEGNRSDTIYESPPNESSSYENDT